MAASSYHSLYRRYRSQRFDEVLGQDHVTRALRNAVRDGRIGHAYLFSGPRGTGKTSTARILAKVLNCAAPKDGEPCGECDNCQSVERGQVTDWLLEQDAASKSKVDDMRDLLDRVPLGTSGNRKVIILDEVHMLSQGAENALLKTLEEPPDHVVFVLATTDPQKVRPTIRSRTQHFEFHLLSPDVMEAHARHVIADAELSLDDVDAAVAYVIRAGGGSARDTLSALDQVAALGQVVADNQPVDAILDAVVASDAGAVLLAVAEATATGREPRAVGEALISRLRDAFLAVMGAGADHLAESERARAHELGDSLGPAGLTRALEVLGEALTELSRKPDPRIVVEVALIRLVRPEADRNIDAVLTRLERLEQAVQSGDPLPSTSTSTSTAAPTQPDPKATTALEAAPADKPRNPPVDPPGGGAGNGPASAARAVLAARNPAGPTSKAGAQATPAPPPASSDPAPPPETAPQREPASDLEPESEPQPSRQGKAPKPAAPDAPPSRESKPPSPQSKTPAAAVPPAAPPTQSKSPAATAPPAAAPPAAPGADAQTPPGAAADLTALTQVWSSRVLGELPISVRSKWRGGAWVDTDAGGVARFAVDNQWHQRACEEGRLDVERALGAALGAPVRVEVVVEGAGGSGPPAVAPTPPPGDASGSDDGGEAVTPEEVKSLPDAKDVATGGVDLLMREFGGELVEEDPR